MRPTLRLFFILSAIVLSLSAARAQNLYPEESVSDFCRLLEPVGRILEEEGYYVWCCAPIFDDEGKVHVFYSRWPKQYKMGGWIGRCEIAHAVADRPEGPYKYVETVLAPP